MFVKQVSVFVENKEGSISKVVSILGKNNINIRALSIADSTDYGILRLIVDDYSKAYNILKENNYTIRITDVLGIVIPDKPNGLGDVLAILSKNEISITYIYSFIGHYKDQAITIIQAANLEETRRILLENSVKVINNNELYKD
ncbi:MAG: ACT domain-containing protein [Acholeplasmatales bacterium]|nr:ACT domain-containing protein [Acholeplasmatales bacterium]